MTLGLKVLTSLLVIWLLAGQIVYRRRRREGRPVSEAAVASAVESVKWFCIALLAKFAVDVLSW